MIILTQRQRNLLIFAAIPLSALLYWILWQHHVIAAINDLVDQGNRKLIGFILHMMNNGIRLLLGQAPT